MMTRNRRNFLMGIAATAFALSAVPAHADVDSRRHVFKPGQNVSGGITRDSEPGDRNAPEIDPAAIGLGLALAAGGLAIVANRRRSSAQ